MVLYRHIEKLKPNKLILSEKWEDGQKCAVRNLKNKHGMNWNLYFLQYLTKDSKENNRA